MRYKILGTISLLLFCLSYSQLAFAQDLKVLEYGGLERSYAINFPDNYDETTASPLLIALHGFGSDGFNLQRGTDIDEIARESGYIAVFPNGYQAGWNYLDENEMEQDEDWTDDVGFLKALIEQVSEDYNINTRRIFIVGLSNGALMALRMGCELDEQLAGIAAVAATYSFELAVHCSDAAVIPTVLVWGSADEVFPVGGFVWASNGKIRSSFSLNQTRSYLLTHYQCQSVGAPSPAQTVDSAYAVQREILIGCGSGVPAFLYLIVGAEHGWPDTSKITLLDGETEASISMTFFEVFNNIQRPEPE
jgi:polyhydroxybutyrate depolymerase